MKHNKATAVFALLCGFLFAAASAWAVQQEKPQAQGQIERPAAGRLGRLLNLTPDQQAKLDAIRKAHQEQRAALRGEMAKLEEEFRGLRDNPQADPKKVDVLIDQIAKLRAEQMKAGFRHRQEINQVLTPEQRDKLMKLRTRVHNRMDRFLMRHPRLGLFLEGRGLFRDRGSRLDRWRRFRDGFWGI